MNETQKASRPAFPRSVLDRAVKSQRLGDHIGSGATLCRAQRRGIGDDARAPTQPHPTGLPRARPRAAADGGAAAAILGNSPPHLRGAGDVTGTGPSIPCRVRAPGDETLAPIRDTVFGQPWYSWIFTGPPTGEGAPAHYRGRRPCRPRCCAYATPSSAGLVSSRLPPISRVGLTAPHDEGGRRLPRVHTDRIVERRNQVSASLRAATTRFEKALGVKTFLPSRSLRNRRRSRHNLRISTSSGASRRSENTSSSDSKTPSARPLWM